VIIAGAQVEHAEFGIGKVLAVLGSTATVEFYGEHFDVEVSELITVTGGTCAAAVHPSREPTTGLAFRRSFEAVNLGVVPADPDQLVKLTIGGNEVSDEIRRLLRDAPTVGVNRVFMGYYGSGKSHHLRLVKAIALREGWVTASLELDPKAADPAKPSSVYKEFFDLVKEMRDNWPKVRSLNYFRSSPWFSNGLEALQYLSHRRDDPDYVSAVCWLAGLVNQVGAIRSSTWRAGYRGNIPKMPQVKDTGLLYAFHLVVIHEVLQALGYRGLAIIIDEAEHVRTYSANRYLRANNFFDILARCAHRPRTDLKDPPCDYDISMLTPFWREGPHFGLFVGLTEGEDTQDLRRKAGEMSVLIHSQEDVVQLKPPTPDDYETWSTTFLAEAAGHLGPKVSALTNAGLRSRIAGSLREHFEQTPDSEKLLRNWTKMAGFPAAVLMSQPRPIGNEELVAIVQDAARQVAGEVFPWDD
jgi:hypothetical protein